MGNEKQDINNRMTRYGGVSNTDQYIEIITIEIPRDQ